MFMSNKLQLPNFNDQSKKNTSIETYLQKEGHYVYLFF